MKELFKKLYKKSSQKFYDELKYRIIKNIKTFIVTANPETFMKSETDSELNSLLKDENTIIVPDGIGIVKASKMVKMPVKERIPGIDIAIKLLEYGNELNKTIYFLGATQEVIDSLNIVITNQYPNLKIVGAKNGFSQNKDKDFEDILNRKPDIIIVALGIPAQEKLIYKHIKKFDKGIFIGVGGSLDVISGHKKRAPKIFIKLNLEWLYRIIKEPKRIKRFYESNIKFFFKIKKKSFDNIFLFLFLLIIFGGLTKVILKPDEVNYYENRMAYQLPISKFSSIINKNYQEEMELAFSDQIPLSTLMKKTYYFYNNIVPYISQKILFKNNCNNYIKISDSIITFGCENNIVYYPMFVGYAEQEYNNRVNNINKVINSTTIDTYIYYIEKDTDVDFQNNTKTDIYDYLKSNINTKNIYRFEINNFDEFKNYFYKTDHHWNYKGSYKAYTELVNILTQDSPLKYNSEICLNNSFSGSKAVTGGASKFWKETFCAYDFDLPEYKITVDGKETFYGNYDYHISNPTENVTYGSFYGGDNAEVIIDNNNPTKENILLIGESYDNAIIELLAAHFNKTFSIDLRHYERVNKKKFDYKSYLIENNINKVVLIGNKDYFNSEIFDLEV